MKKNRENDVEPDWAAVSMRAKTALDNTGLHPKDVAKRASMGVRTIYKVLQNEKTTKGSAALMAAGLGVNPDWLIWGDPPEPQWEEVKSKVPPLLTAEEPGIYRTKKPMTYIHHEGTKSGVSFGGMIDAIIEHLRMDGVTVIEGLVQIREQQREEGRKDGHP